MCGVKGQGFSFPSVIHWQQLDSQRTQSACMHVWPHYVTMCALTLKKKKFCKPHRLTFTHCTITQSWRHSQSVLAFNVLLLILNFSHKKQSNIIRTSNFCWQSTFTSWLLGAGMVTGCQQPQLYLLLCASEMVIGRHVLISCCASLLSFLLPIWYVGCLWNNDI